MGMLCMCLAYRSCPIEEECFIYTYIHFFCTGKKKKKSVNTQISKTELKMQVKRSSRTSHQQQPSVSLCMPAWCKHLHPSWILVKPRETGYIGGIQNRSDCCFPSKHASLWINCAPPLVSKVIVWGNYGRMERKHFMGVARVLLEELDLSTLAIGWYKLFPTSSMVDPTTGPLLRQSSQLSLESTVGPCCDRS